MKYLTQLFFQLTQYYMTKEILSLLLGMLETCKPQMVSWVKNRGHVSRPALDCLL